MNSIDTKTGLTQEIEQFFYYEARMLDERQFEEWLQLFSDDIRYWMPVVSTRERGGREIAGDNELAFFDDNKTTLTLRVKRLYTDFAFAEEPPSRTSRFISNVQVESSGSSPEEVLSHCKFLVYRTRLETDMDVFFGTRKDTLHRVNGSWQIVRRKIILAQNVLGAKNLSIFF